MLSTVSPMGYNPLSDSITINNLLIFHSLIGDKLQIIPYIISNKIP